MNNLTDRDITDAYKLSEMMELIGFFHLKFCLLILWNMIKRGQHSKVIARSNQEVI